MADTPQARERFVSKKLWVKEILEGNYTTEGTEANTLQTARTAAGRVNIIGVIIAKEEMPVASITIDDGTGQIIVRSFDKPIPLGIGVIVQVIGRPRTYQGQLYIAAELLTRVDPGWAEFRRTELGPVQENVQKQVEEVSMEENNAEKLLRIIKELDTGEGADIDEVISNSKLANAESIINQMLMNGDVFELRPGRIKPL